MDKKLIAELDSIFEAHSKATEDKRKVADAAEQKRQAFLVNFERITKGIIVPTFEEFGVYIKERGIESSIEDKQQTYERGTSTSPRSVAMNFHIAEKSARVDGYRTYPSFSLIVDSTTENIRLHRNTTVPGRGGQSGDYGKCTVDQVTPAFLNEQLVALMKIILAS